jgi:hypothetical protein
MHGGGRKPKNPALRLVTGGRSKDAPVDRAVFETEWGDPATGRPDLQSHKWLGKRAREIWAEMLPNLPWLKAIDGYAFARWCHQEAEYQQHGRNDWPVSMLVEHRRCGDAIAIELGNKHRLEAVKPPKDEAEDFFGGKG